MQSNDHAIKLKDGRKLGYAEYGDPDGQPLLYFHGWPGCRWMAQVDGAAAEKLHIRIISIDRPGFGLSDYQGGRTLLDWPDDVIELADQLKINKFAVMGVSGGGPYAAACAYRIPERLTKVGIVVGLAPIDGFAILKGMSPLSKLGWGNYHRIPGLIYFAAWLSSFQSTHLPFFNFLKFTSKYDQKLLTKETYRKIGKSHKEAYRQGIKGPAWDLKIYTDDWGFKLKEIKAKVYLWYGADDRNVGIVMGKYYAREIPGSKLIIYPNEGHLCRLNHTEEILGTLASPTN